MITMATIPSANASLSDLERGRVGFHGTRRISYVRDITYKVIPFCVVFLIIFSVGAVLVSTLVFNKPVPHEGTVVISILLAIFLFLFCIGGMYLYWVKHYPPLAEKPDVPDRPSPLDESRKEKSKGHSIDNRTNYYEPSLPPLGTPHNPAELERPTKLTTQPPSGQERYERGPLETPSNVRPYRAPRNPIPRNNSWRKKDKLAQSPRRRPRQKRPLPPSPLRNSFSPGDATISEGNITPIHPPYPVQDDFDKRTGQQPSNANGIRNPRREGGTSSSTNRHPAHYGSDPPPRFQLEVTPAEQRARSASHVNGLPSQRGRQPPSTPQGPRDMPRANGNLTSSANSTPQSLRVGRERMESLSPRAYFVRISEGINQRAFAEAFQDGLAGGGLYILNKSSGLPVPGPEEEVFGDWYQSFVEKLELKIRPPKADAIPTNARKERGSTLEFEESFDISSSMDSSSPRPMQKLRAQRPVVTPEARDDRNPEYVTNRRKSKGANSPSSSHRRDTKPEGHQTRKPSNRPPAPRRTHSSPKSSNHPKTPFNTPVLQTAHSTNKPSPSSPEARSSLHRASTTLVNESLESAEAVYKKSGRKRLTRNSARTPSEKD